MPEHHFCEGKHTSAAAGPACRACVDSQRLNRQACRALVALVQPETLREALSVCALLKLRYVSRLSHVVQ